MTTDSVPLLQLMQTKGVGPRSIARVLAVLEHNGLSLHDFAGLEPDDMAERFGLTKDQARSIIENEELAARTAQLLDDHRVCTIVRGSATYPARLATVLGDHAPSVLFASGSLELLHQRGVGFCGARDASEEA